MENTGRERGEHGLHQALLLIEHILSCSFSLWEVWSSLSVEEKSLLI